MSYDILLLKPLIEILTGNFSSDENQINIIFYIHTITIMFYCVNSTSMILANFKKKKRLQKLTYLRFKHIFCGFFTGKFMRSKYMVHSMADPTYY